jgi:hypothetical protein
MTCEAFRAEVRHSESTDNHNKDNRWIDLKYFMAVSLLDRSFLDHYAGKADETAHEWSCNVHLPCDRVKPTLQDRPVGFRLEVTSGFSIYPLQFSKQVQQRRKTKSRNKAPSELCLFGLPGCSPDVFS